MFAIYLVVSSLLAGLLVFAAVRKLSHRPEVVASYARVGVPDERLDLLALVLLAGATGLLIGVVFAPLGVITAGCVVLYFLAAIAAHVKHADTRHAAVPLVILCLALATLALRVATM